MLPVKPLLTFDEKKLGCLDFLIIFLVKSKIKVPESVVSDIQSYVISHILTHDFCMYFRSVLSKCS